jgi:hypothetical protein
MRRHALTATGKDLVDRLLEGDEFEVSAPAGEGDLDPGSDHPGNDEGADGGDGNVAVAFNVTPGAADSIKNLLLAIQAAGQTGESVSWEIGDQ